MEIRITRLRAYYPRVSSNTAYKWLKRTSDPPDVKNSICDPSSAKQKLPKENNFSAALFSCIPSLYEPLQPCLRVYSGLDIHLSGVLCDFVLGNQ